MPWKPSVDGEIPTLGYEVLDWITAALAAPDHADYVPFVPYREQEDFILRWYALDPDTGRRRYSRGVLGRPRGWGKSPLLAAIACVEAMGPVVPDGWDAAGQPVGTPWSRVRTPWVQLAAVSEEQTRNTWAPVLEMLRAEAPVHDLVRGLEPMESFVALPNRGRMESITSSARTVKGARAVFAVLDQSEEWVPSNGGIKLANTMRSNAAKVGGTTLESPNAFIPGEGSVAEESAAFHDAILSGRSRDDGLLYDHRESPADTDMTDRESLIAGLRVSYGDSSAHPGGCVIHDVPCLPGHVELDRLVATIWDPAQDVQQSRSDFLNQITHASDAWVSGPEWAARVDLNRALAPGDRVVLGFDGSRGRVRGKADATALIGCRIADGYLFEIGVWEQPAGPVGKGWMPNPLEVDRTVREAFESWKVVGFYADPSGWTEHIAKWEAAFGKRLRVKATQGAPITVWPRGKDARVSHYVEQLRVAIVTGECAHDGAPSLTRHVLNARKRHTRTGYLLYKAYPDSPEKIDAAYAAVMAWKARTDALAAGLGKTRPR
ncbi:terminase, partial [Rhodococcus jostii]|uniref:terminase n=1 Tax=Rhodococcus jostii TaxID=132919 RepID=UPI003665E726